MLRRFAPKILALALALSLGIVLVVASRLAKDPKLSIDAASQVGPSKNKELLGLNPQTKQVESLVSRNVGGDEVVAPVSETASLERIAPLPQPTPPQQPKPIQPKTPVNHLRWKLVFNSVITSAGIFQAGDSALILPEIDVISADQQCTTPDGKTWPCGMVARTAFRNYINGRALTCKVPDFPPDKSYLTECRIQGRDPAEWLVANGWAKAKVDGAYVVTEAQASAAKRGIFGSPPSGVEVTTP